MPLVDLGGDILRTWSGPGGSSHKGSLTSAQVYQGHFCILRPGRNAERNHGLYRFHTEPAARPAHRHSVWPKNECDDPQVLTETDKAGGGSRGRTRQTEPQTRKGTRYRRLTLPSPHTLARRRFRLAGKCPVIPIMQGYRQGQAFSAWRGGQTE